MKTKWHEETIIRAYDGLRQELGRVPTQMEFRKKYNGAFSAINNGRVNPNVKTWNGFLRYVGENINPDPERWDSSEKITRVYEAYKQELGRVPTQEEFTQKCRGAIGAIRNGKIISGVTNWNEFLKYMGEDLHHDMNRWDKPEKIVQAYEECRRKLGRVPTQEEFAEKYSGAIGGIMKGKIIPNVRTWNGFLRYMGETLNWDMQRWNTPEKIIQAYEELKRELGRVPTANEFREKQGGVLMAITKGKVIPNVRTWNGFLRYRGEEINVDRERWNTPEKIVQAYEELKRELGRVPTQDEFTIKYGGVITALKKRKLLRGVTNWNEFLKYMGEDLHHDMNRWDKPEKIVQAYEECRRKLGRVPTSKEFTEQCGGALGVIIGGKFMPEINSWNGFLQQMGENISLYRDIWNKERVIQAYEECRQELGRVPTKKEFTKKYSGALSALERRKVIPEAPGWNCFLKYMGEEVNCDIGRWDSPESVIQAYEKLKQELKRVPTSKEFGKRYSGALKSIKNRRIISDVTSWNDFVRYMGDEPRQKRKKPISLLESLLEEGEEK